ncbi:MAG TPA: hypothetical protein VGQ92_11965 [Actinoplanes sp.]|jgi:RNase adaptor protein for sRNA GlmZ degradation|nr:hypothetical protein [Actinoplanes sp.]
MSTEDERQAIHAIVTMIAHRVQHIKAGQQQMCAVAIGAAGSRHSASTALAERRRRVGLFA